MVRFDLSTLPKNATIQSASLDLTIYSDECSGSFQMFRVSKNWIMNQTNWNKATSTTNWNNGGGDFFAVPESAWQATGAPFFVRGSVMKFNVTKTVKDFYATPSSNFGWILKNKLVNPPDASEGMAFYATNHGGQEARYPKLVINYTTGSVSANPASATVSHTIPHFALKGRILSLPSSLGNAQVTVSALNGTRIFSQSANAMQTVDLSAQPSGVYLVTIKTAGSCISGSIALE